MPEGLWMIMKTGWRTGDEASRVAQSWAIMVRWGWWWRWSMREGGAICWGCEAAKWEDRATRWVWGSWGALHWGWWTGWETGEWAWWNHQTLSRTTSLWCRCHNTESRLCNSDTTNNNYKHISLLMGDKAAGICFYIPSTAWLNLLWHKYSCRYLSKMKTDFIQLMIFNKNILLIVCVHGSHQFVFTLSDLKLLVVIVGTRNITEFTKLKFWE